MARATGYNRVRARERTRVAREIVSSFNPFSGSRLRDNNMCQLMARLILYLIKSNSALSILIFAHRSPLAITSSRACVCYFTIRARGYRSSRNRYLSIYNPLACILFDSGSSYYSIAQDFASTLGLEPVMLQRSLEITSPVGKGIVIRWAC